MTRTQRVRSSMKPLTVARERGTAAAVNARFARITWVCGTSMLALLIGCEKVAEPLRSRAQTELLSQADALRGQEVINRYGCVACHTIPGVRGPASNVGPPLANMASRAYVAGILPNTPEDMVQWLRDPPAVDPRTAMPNMGLTEKEAKDVAAYLYTLD